MDGWAFMYPVQVHGEYPILIPRHMHRQRMVLCYVHVLFYSRAKGRQDSDRYHEGVKYVLLHDYQGLSLFVNGNASKKSEGARKPSEAIQCEEGLLS